MEKIKRVFSILFFLVLSLFIFSCSEEENEKKINLDDIYLTIFENIDLTDVSSDLTLPTKMDEVVIVWDSSNEDVLTSEGKVTRKETDTVVTLIATLVYNGDVKKYTESVTIKGTGVIEVKPNLHEIFENVFAGINVNGVRDNINLPTKVENVTIEWVSSNPEVVTNNGVVNQDNVDVTVTLTAKLTYKDEMVTLTKEIIVLADALIVTDFEKVAMDKEALTLESTVSSDFNLAQEGENGSIITWEVTLGNAIVIEGTTAKVTRGEIDETVKLTATITLNEAITTKEFTVVVLKEIVADLSELEEALKEFADHEEWNFAVDYIIKADGESSSIYYEFEGNNFSLEYEYDGEVYKDFVVLGDDDIYKYYYMISEDEYIIVSETDEDFYVYYMADYLDLSGVVKNDFVKENDYYKAINPQKTGKLIFGDYEGDTWEYVYVYVENGKIIKISAESNYDDGEYEINYEYDLTFNSYGDIELTIPSDENQGNDPDDNPVDATSVTYSFENSTGVNVSLTNDSALKLFNNSSNVASSLLSSVEVDKVYDGNGQGGAYENQSGFIKLGTSKANGELRLQFANNMKVSKVEILCHDWYKKNGSNPTNSNTISVNGCAPVLAPYNANGTCETLTFNVNGDNYVEIVSSLRVFIFSIKVYFGEVSLDIMEEQEIVSGSNEDRLEDMLSEHDEVGLPNEGKYDVLVVPVQFSNTTVSDADITKLELAFNDKEGLTGWESVSSYYYKASYGKLDLHFDIANIYKSSRTSSYYNNIEYGEEALMLEVLAFLEPLYDLNDYDYNNDGVIDGIYLIYSENVDYEDDESIYWAFVSWYITENDNDRKTFDGLDVYYYLFAGLDFMDEDAKESSDGFEYNKFIEGLKVNASTYIHETGHMLGLDDYYDYDTSAGSNEGVGGADMMDYTVGDHSSYSKTILGWVTPVVVTEDTTITIESFEKSGDCVMILLDSDGSYFSEYLLIDLYTNTGLNAMHSSLNDSLLYDGAEYGVRVYHVDSSITDPFSDDYQSLTDNNNTLTKDPLIKLVEADGENSFNSSDGYAMSYDLWQSNDVFSEVFSMYTRNDGKLINFDISFDNVTSTEATITITFK